jgi:NADH-quinone oxidoreductase subunit I
MAITYAPTNERKLGLKQQLYFPAIFEGMGFTFRHMFKKKVTVQYPEEKVVLGAEFRGRPVLVAEHGKERCVACGLCARACPPLAISMQAAEIEVDAKERYPSYFEIDMLRCIYCGLCEEVCPEEAIVMSKEYDFNFQNRRDAIMDKPKLMKDKSEVRERLDFLAQFRNPNFGKVFAFQESNNIHTYRNRPTKVAAH